MQKLKHLLIEQQTKCPIATQDIHVNLKNRQHGIDEYHYGPLDPNQILQMKLQKNGISLNT